MTAFMLRQGFRVGDVVLDGYRFDHDSLSAQIRMK